MPITLGIIGSGTIGKYHAEVIEKTGGHIAAFCDINTKRAEEAAAKHDGAIAVASVDAILKMKDRDTSLRHRTSSCSCPRQP